MTRYRKPHITKFGPPLVVTVDKEDFVQEVRLDVAEETSPLPPLRKCTGPWHYKNGKGTLIAESEFNVATRGKNRGQLGSTCKYCRDRSNVSSREHYGRTKMVESPNGVEVAPLTSETLPQWRVTIIKRTEVIVAAKDYLDAGVAAGDGEVVKVERLQ